MTARLKDQAQFSDRDEAEAARLLGVLGRAPDPALESRVYARLMAQPGATVYWQRRWVVACVALLLVSTTILAAALVHRWLAKSSPTSNASPMGKVEPPAPQAPVARPASETSDRIAVPSTARGGVDSPPPIAQPSAPAVPAPPSHPVTARRRSAGQGNVPTKHEAAPTETQAQATETSSSEARMAAAPSEEATMVLAALRALRRGHDPVKAGALLEQYLARFSGGVLVEEALALGMEAALDRNDAAAAIRLAERYTQRYPAGRFSGLARRAMGNERP
jgi:hypothetical protein